MADIHEIVPLSQVVCTGPTHPFSLDDRFRFFPCHTAAVPHLNLYAKFHPCSPACYTKSEVLISVPKVEITPPISFNTAYEECSCLVKAKWQMSPSHILSQHGTITNTLSHAFKRGQQLCNLQTYSSEEPRDTVRWQHVKSVGLTAPYMTSGIT